MGSQHWIWVIVLGWNTFFYQLSYLACPHSDIKGKKKLYCLHKALKISDRWGQALNKILTRCPLRLREHYGRGEGPEIGRRAAKHHILGKAQWLAYELTAAMAISSGFAQEWALEQLGMDACQAQGPHPSVLNYFLADGIRERGNRRLWLCTHSPNTLKAPIDSFSSTVTLRALVKLDG